MIAGKMSLAAVAIGLTVVVAQAQTAPPVSVTVQNSTFSNYTDSNGLSQVNTNTWGTSYGLTPYGWTTTSGPGGSDPGDYYPPQTVTGCSSFGNYTGAGFLTWNGTTQLTQAVGNEAANTTYDLSLLAGSLGDLNAPGIYTFQLLAGTTPLITMTGSMSSMPLLYLTPDKQAWGLYGQAFDGKSVETPATVAPNTPLTIVLSLSTDVGGTGGPLGVTNVALTSAQNYIPGDINGDGLVDVADYNIWAANVGKTGATWAQGDLNGDGLVDVADYNIWAANVGRTSATPEPISMLILAIGGGLVALKRSSILRPQAQGRKD